MNIPFVLSPQVIAWFLIGYSLGSLGMAGFWIWRGKDRRALANAIIGTICAAGAVLIGLLARA